jgi:hypothetical protein
LTASDTDVRKEVGQKLPLWRAITAFLVLGIMVAVLLALTPVYVENYRLRQYLTTLLRAPNAATTPDDTLRSEVLAEAHRLDLPVMPADVKVTHAPGEVEMQVKYAVQMDFPFYQVDLHFHPGASSR